MGKTGPVSDVDGTGTRPDPALVDLVTGLLGAVRRWGRLGTGLDHHTWQADTDDATWVIRAPTAGGGAGPDAGPEARLTQAARAAGLRWAPELRALPPLPGQPAGVTAHRLVPGRPLLEILAARGDGRAPGERDLVRIGRQLGSFIAALGQLPAGELALPVDPPDPGEWLASTAAALDDARPVLHPDRIAAIERFLAAPPPRFPDVGHLVVAHHDLGAEHVLVDRSLAVTGVIDWTDAAVTDPAADHGRILRDLGEAAHRAATIAWSSAAGPATTFAGDMAGAPTGGVSPLPTRARWFARCLAVEDLAFAIDHRPATHEYALAQVDRLFGPAGR